MYMYLLLCYCIGYTSNNDWSTSIISALHYTVVPDIILIFILCTFIHVLIIKDTSNSVLFDETCMVNCHYYFIFFSL